MGGYIGIMENKMETTIVFLGRAQTRFPDFSYLSPYATRIRWKCKSVWLKGFNALWMDKGGSVERIPPLRSALLVSVFLQEPRR